MNDSEDYLIYIVMGFIILLGVIWTIAYSLGVL